MKRLAAIVVGIVPLLAFAQGPERLKDQAAALLKADQDNPPSKEGVLFAGNENVANWDVRRDFGQYRTIRRGLAGATIADTIFYADQLIVPFKPSTIILDPEEGSVTPDALAGDFTKFVAKIHKELPKTMIVVLSVRAVSMSVDAARQANEKLKAIVAQDRGIRFADLESLAGPDGKPDPSLMVDGKPLLNKLGYQILAQTIRKEVQRAEARYWRGYDPVDGQ